MIPPTLPTLLRGAINDGIDQPTGDAAERPPMEMLIQMSAVIALCVFALDIGCAPAVLEIVAALLTHEAILDAAKIDPGV